jgi:nucleoid-associated protein YgaU
VPPESVLVYQTKGRGETDAGGETGGAGERLDEIAAKTYGDPALWRLVASFNNLDDPSSVPPGTVLQLPPPSALGRTA